LEKTEKRKRVLSRRREKRKERGLGGFGVIA
jgi:hypothetical protein